MTYPSLLFWESNKRNTFKSTYQIMDELSQKWKDLSDIQQATIIELMAGKHQGNVFASLMTNFDTARDALDTSLNSSGSAMEEHGKWSDSLEARLNKLKATWQSLAQTFMKSDFLKVLIDLLSGLVNVLEKVLDNFGLFGTIGLGVIGKGIVATFKYFKGGKEAAKTINDVVDAVNNLTDTVANGASATSEMGESMANVSSASTEAAESTTNLASSATEASESVANLDSTATETAETMVNLSSATTEAAEATVNIASASTEAAEATANLASVGTEIVESVGNITSATTEAAEAAVNMGSAAATAGDTASKAAGGLKAFATSGAGIALGVGIAIAAIGLMINAYKNYREEQAKIRRETIETSDAFLDSAGKFEQAYIKYSGRTDLTSEEENDLASAINSTVDALGDKSSALQNVVNGSKDYIKSLEQISRAELESAKNIAETKRNNAAEELSSINNDLLTSLGISFGHTANMNVESDRKKTFDIAKEILSDYYDERGIGARKTASFELPNNASVDEIVEYYDALLDYQNKLYEEGLDSTTVYSLATGVITKLSGAVEVYRDAIYDTVKAQYQLSNGIPKTTEEYLKMRESILNSDDLQGLSLDAKNIIANTLDSEYKSVFDLTTAEVQARKLVGIIKSYGDGSIDGTNEIGTVETFLNMRTAVNNNECSVGEYLSKFNEINNMTANWSDEEKEVFNASFGIDTDAIKEQFEDLKTKLTDEYYGINMSDDNAETFLNNLGLRELSATRDLFSSDNVDFKNILQNYSDTLNKAKEDGVDFSKTVFGNIDTNARQTLEWTSENLSKYKDEIMSWEPDASTWDSVQKDLEGSISTVMGAWETFDIGDDKEVPIAFSPMLQTDNGAEILSSSTVNTYINKLIAKATEDGKWDENELIALDAQGLEIDGQKIKGILADIGDTAEATASQMHYVGKDGALALAESELFAIVEAQAKLAEAMSFTIKIDVETAGIEALNTALAESKSAAGLTAESIDALKARYGDLDGYNVAALFEETASGIRVNSTELAKLEKEYKDFNKQEIDETLKTLTDEYDNLTDEIVNCTDDQEKLNELYNKRSDILDQINNVASLAAQYEGLTSAYNEWQRAQEAGQDRDPYENILTGREEIEGEMSRGWLDDAAVEYLELLSGKDLSTDGIDAQIAAYKELDKNIGNTKYSVWDFFTEDDDGNSTSDGVFNFFDTVKSVAGETAAWIDENGKYNFDFEGFEYNGKTGDAAIAEVLGTSEELVQILLRAAEDAGFVINIEGDYTDLADAVNEAEKANDRMKALGATTYTFNFETTDIDNLNEQISEAKTMLSNLKNEDGTLKVGVSEEDYRQARDIIYSLILQKQRLDDSAVLHVDTEQAKTDIEIAISKLKDFKEYANTLEVKTAVGADTSEVTSNIQGVLEEINKLKPEIKTGLGLDATEVQAAINSVQADIKAGVAIKQEDLDIVNSAISSISNDAMINLGLDTTLIDNYKSTEQTAKGTVNWDNNIEKVTAWINQTHEASGTVKWDDDTSNLKTTYTGNGVIYWNTSEANGTANAHGTAFSRGSAAGKAYKQGDWGIKGNGSALGGELGTEILVRDGRWYTIGDSGAEFFNYKKGDIIFNHKQTEELFANGKVTSGGGRGKAFANGSAFASGSTGSGNLKSTIKSAIKEANNETSSKKEKDSSSGSSGSNGSGSTKNTIKNATKSTSSTSSTKTTDDDFEETFDWIEIAVSRVERAIDQLDQTANATYKSWSTRNNALTKEISKVGSEIDLQEKAYNRYMQEANSVGLSSSWKKKVQNGTVDISTIKNEGLAEKIKEYQKWYELALQTKDTIQDLKDKEAGLYSQRFENISSEYEAKLGDINNQKSIVEENIKQSDYDTSVEDLNNEDYKSIIALEKQSITQLKNQKRELEASLKKAVEDGTIKQYSEEWYAMKSTIDNVALGIEQSTSNILTSYEEMFDGIAEKYNSTIGLFDSEKSLSEVKNERSKYDTSVNNLNNDNYNDIITQETNTYNTLAQQKREQEAALKDLEKDGYTKGSKKWNEKKAEINNTALQMEQAALNISNAYSDMFDNVSAKYDGVLQGFEHTETMLNEYISQAEADGHIVSSKYYQALIDNEESNISSLKSKQADLIAARDKAVEDGKVTKYSQEWYRMCGDIDNVTQSIENGTTKLKEYDKAMRQIEWDKFDMKQEHISDVTAESDFMIKLMSSKDMHDDNGNLTAQGAATLGLHGLNHNTYMYQADDYAAQIADIDRRTKLDKNDKDYLDPNSKDVINRRRELVKLQQDSILAAEGEKQAIKDLVEEGINKELDSLQELIDKKNEALQSEKDLYEYQKKVKEQTKEIASLEKQMAAYKNDDSEEAKAKIQELKVSLEDAEESLRETEWDKYIQDTSALLDSLYTEYETILNTRLDNIDDLLSQVVSGINASMGEGGTIDTALGAEGAIATAIADTVSENGGMKTILNAELGAVGATLSTEMDSIWTTEGTGTNSVLATYGKGFQSKQTTTNQTLSGIKTAVDNMATDSDEEADEKTNDNKTSPSSKKDPTGDNNKKDTPKDEKPKDEKPKDEKPKDEKPKKDPPKQKTSGDGVAKVGDKVKFTSGKYYYDSQGKNPIGSKNLGKEVYITKINTKSWATHPYHISTGKTLGKGDLGWLKLNQLSGYAAGKRRISNSQYAWTQENGQEYIIRPSDGAILTPVAKGDSVLNATASGNIWQMANNPAEFIKNNLSLDAANVPSGANVQSNYTQHLDKVVFNLPNVKNYDELLASLQKDKNFERLILSMSIDRLAGKSGLAKGKSIR